MRQRVREEEEEVGETSHRSNISAMSTFNVLCVIRIILIVRMNAYACILVCHISTSQGRTLKVADIQRIIQRIMPSQLRKQTENRLQF